MTIMSDLTLPGVPCYEGTSCSGATEFLNRFEGFANYHKGDDAAKLAFFPLYLTKTSQAWFQTYKNVVEGAGNAFDWKTLLTKFKKTFASKLSTEH